VYRLNYSVSSPDPATGGSNSAFALRRVIVYQTGRMSASLVLYPTVEAAAGAALAAALRVPASPEAAAARATLRERIAAAGGGALGEGDVAIDGASVQPLGGGSSAVRVVVAATVCVSYPRDLVEDTAGGGAATRRRQLRELPAANSAGAGGGGHQGNGFAAEAAGAASETADAPDDVPPQPGSRIRGQLRQLTSLLDALGQQAQSPSRAGGSRRLQQAAAGSGSLDTAFASVGAALQNGLGAAPPTRAADTPPVDTVGGYLAALSISLGLLEQRAAAAEAGVAGVATKVEQAFGSDAQQKDAAKDTEVTNLYQVGPGWLWLSAGRAAGGQLEQWGQVQPHCCQMPGAKPSTYRKACQLQSDKAVLAKITSP
jgi:hypothetical protein